MAEAIGLAASVLQIAQVCVHTVHTLDVLRHRYKNAPDSIDALYTESSAIGASLSQLSSLIEQKDETLTQALRTKPELSTALKTALGGCGTVFKLLQDKLETLVPKDGEGGNQFLVLKRRASFLWSQDLLKGYLSQIHGHQAALSLLLHGLQMSSLGDINALLKETKAILTNMANDQLTLRGSPSAQHLDASDTENELDDHFEELKKDPRGLEIVWSRNRQAPHRPTASQEDLDLIDLRDPPSLLDAQIEESLSPTFEELRLLEIRQDDGRISPSTKLRSGSSSIIEKRDSAQSTTQKTPSVVLRRESGASNHSQGHRNSEALSPLPWENYSASFRSNGSASGGSTPANGRINRTTSLDSEFPEVVSSQSASGDPFPVIKNPPPFLPPTAEEQEADLIHRRNGIIVSHDTDAQLQWAEEALHFVSINNMHRRRISKTQNQKAVQTPAEGDLEAEAKLLVQAHLRYSHKKAIFLQAMYFGLEPSIAMELYKTSLANGYHRSAFYIANMLESNPKIKKSTIIGYYQEGAAANDSACCCRLGEAYLYGELGLKKEVKDAVWHLRKAAEHPDRDFPRSLFLLGLLQTSSYRQHVKIRDSILPIDDSAAREKFKQGAQLGCSKSQVHLGHAFRSARLGCKSDYTIALHYFRLAARQGESEADHQISTWFGWGVPGFVEVHPKLAFVHGRRAAEDDYAPALAQVGYFYEHGIGVAVNREKAVEWYLKAVARGDKQAGKRLDALRSKGTFGASR